MMFRRHCFIYFLNLNLWLYPKTMGKRQKALPVPMKHPHPRQQAPSSREEGLNARIKVQDAESANESPNWLRMCEMKSDHLFHHDAVCLVTIIW
ncbi:hypothetical protein C0J52_11023 [Blattella germanica]|nr:hypothetical protein C0J52_11023 [Blattella germanica]